MLLPLLVLKIHWPGYQLHVYTHTIEWSKCVIITGNKVLCVRL